MTLLRMSIKHTPELNDDAKFNVLSRLPSVEKLPVCTIQPAPSIQPQKKGPFEGAFLMSYLC